MIRMLLFALAALVSAAASADDVALRIEPELGFSSDQATLCRVTARNDSGHALDGRAIAFEAQAWRDGVVVQTARGRFGGILEPGGTAESRIGFNGVFSTFTIAASEDKSPVKRSGSRKAAKSGASSKTSRAPKTSRSPKSRAAKPPRNRSAK